MANINRDYLIVLDAKSSVISEADELKYYITDEHSQNLFVNLVVRDIERINKYVEVHDPEKYELELHIVKPNNDIVRPHLQASLLSAEDALYEFELPKEAVDYIGTYKCELRVTYQETDETTITTSNKFKYKVKRSIYNDLDSIQDAPQYPVVIQLFDKLSDINQYEEDRRANELARQLAEQQRQTRFDALDADMVDSIQQMDDKVVEVENRITTKEQAVDKLIADTKADIDDYKVAKDQEIDDYKTTKDTEINNAITAQDNKINTAITTQNDIITQAIANQDTKINTAIIAQNDKIEAVQNNDAVQNNKLDTLQNKATIHEERITATEVKNTEQDNRLDIIENTNIQQNSRLTAIEDKNIEQDNRLNEIEAIDVSQNNRLDIIEVKNQEQDDRLLDIEKVNKRQDMDLKCLFAESKNNMIDVTEEGNSVYLQNSTVGYTLIDEIQGNTMVNCNKEADKELILNGNINTRGYSNVTLTEGVDGGLVDVALEGNTMVNVCDQKDPVAITKSYTVENSGNHVALQGEYDGKCRPVVTGNTLWIDNDTEDVLTAFDDAKNLRLQSSFEDKVVTQEMVDAGEELAENLGKYKVDYVISREDGTIGQTKTFYLNSPLLEGDTIEQQRDNVVHVHRYGKIKLNDLFQGTGRVFDNGVLHFGNNKYLHVQNANNTICDKMITTLLNSSVSSTSNAICTTMNSNQWRIYVPGLTTLDEYIDWIANSDINIVYQLASPQYEVISQNDTILCDSYTNGHLDVDSVVLIEKVDFLPFTDELTYLYANTQYAVQFTSDKAVTVDITLGGTQLLAQSIVVGLNRIAITTPETLADNKLIINGVGANISEVVVTEATDQEFGYFEGMKSVGECENLEVVSSNSDNTLSNTQTLTHEPLRAVGDIKDKYMLIDGKWYIERNCGYRNNYSICDAWANENLTNRRLKLFKLDNSIEEFGDMNALRKVKSNKFKCVQYGYMDGRFNVPFLAYITENGNLWVSADINYTQQDMLNYINDCQFVYELQTPTYEPIDYNPLEVYSGTTHITTNSTIPANITVKNHGYNCLLKPSTTYTVSSNLGINTVTTPDTLTEDCLRFMDTDTSDVTTMKNVMVLEGDYTTGKPLPSHFSGIESAFEQEYDKEKGKYKVKIRVQNEDASKENYIEFYIDEPLRGIGDVKDKVYVKNDKVVVERNCGQREYQDGDFGTYLTDKVNTVYQLAKPTYEEVEYNDVKLFIESFKNSTLFYNSNVPVTSKLYYSYSVPIVDTVAQTANVTDQQDSMIIDLATQVAVMEMMLM